LTKRSSQQQFYFDTRDLKSAHNIQGAMKESGDVIFSGAKIYLELGEALAGRVPPRANEATIFKSLGIAAEDIATATLVYERRDQRTNCKATASVAHGKRSACPTTADGGTVGCDVWRH
jgi:ornithine cyclodeaminase/alanine dehydrogenase-like protein (mu-crystallin family)